MSGIPGNFTNEFVQSILNTPAFDEYMQKKYGSNLHKADTISQATNLLWYDLSEVVQQLYPYKELTPRISSLPRVSGDGGNSHRWKRVVGVNVNNLGGGIAEGDRGGRIAMATQDMMSKYYTLGFEA